MQIVVGSTSVHKLNAVTQACEEVGIESIVTGVKTDSGVNEQPIGLQETLTGAHKRARQAKQQKPDCIAIGIESGILRAKSDMLSVNLDIAIVVILANNNVIVTSSVGIRFPNECIEEAGRIGFRTTTAGSIIAKTFGGDGTDPHATLTKGKVTRQETLVGALSAGLRQL